MKASTIIQIAAGLYFTYDFVRYIRSGYMGRHFTIFLRRKPAEWVLNILLAAANIGLLYGLLILMEKLNSPILNFSWLQLIEKDAAGGNLVAAASFLPFVGIFFVALLALNIPRLARIEEEVFRRGTKSWAEAIPRSIKFGLIHLVVAVPVMVAVALIVSGLIFSWRYFVGGVRESTFYHTMHNYVALSALAPWIVKSMAG